MIVGELHLDPMSITSTTSPLAHRLALAARPGAPMPKFSECDREAGGGLRRLRNCGEEPAGKGYRARGIGGEEEPGASASAAAGPRKASRSLGAGENKRLQGVGSECRC